MEDEFVDVGGASDLGDGEGLRVPRERLGTIDDVGIFRDGDEFFAIDNTCTHELASLTEGWIEQCMVECPLHAAKFDLRTGAALSLPAERPVRAHRVTIVDDRIMLAVDPASLSPSA